MRASQSAAVDDWHAYGGVVPTGRLALRPRDVYAALVAFTDTAIVGKSSVRNETDVEPWSYGKSSM